MPMQVEIISLKEALSLAVKVLTKTCDSTTLTPEKFDIATITCVGKSPLIVVPMRRWTY